MEGTDEAKTRAALDRFERFLHRKDLRLTEARAAIVEAALARSGHYPIEDLIADLKARGIRGSKATVYRTLPLLAEAGILQPAIIAADTKSYETTFGRGHHDHLLCSDCGKVVEFEFEAFEILQRDVASKHGFRLSAHYHELVGICPDCLQKGPAPIDDIVEDDGEAPADGENAG
jgi:Fur family ferric uptake transcriptional regulator